MGAALYKTAPDAKKLAALGLTPDDVGTETINVWPDNWQAFIVFDAMGTQWRSGMGGATGLDYAVLPEVWRRTKTPVADRDDVFDAIRVMESAALDEMHKT